MAEKAILEIRLTATNVGIYVGKLELYTLLDGV